MSFVKERWLVLAALIVVLCVSLGTVLMIRSSGPVEPKTVSLLPKPNPERAEILKRASKPPKRVYTSLASNEATTVGASDTDHLKSANVASSEANKLRDEELESMLAAIDEEKVGVASESYACRPASALA